MAAMQSSEPGSPALRLSLVSALLSLGSVDSGEAERRLLNTLMEQYNKLERPVYNESEPLVLTFGLTLQQIIDVVSFYLLVIAGTLTRHVFCGSWSHHFLLIISQSTKPRWSSNGTESFINED